MKNRIELAEEFARRDYKIGAEIGVADGRFAEIIFDKNPQLKELHLIDPWVPYGNNWRDEKYQEQAFLQAQNRFIGKDTNRVVHFHKVESVTAYEVLDIPELDFVFIDGAHDFDNVMLDIILWSKKVKKGGIVAGHDYYHFKSGNVISAVNAYVEANGVDLNIITRDKDAHKDDQVPCWWFKK